MAQKLLIILATLLFITSCTGNRHINFNHHNNIEQNRQIRNVRVAVVLGGGGARGIAHIGALEVLEKNNIPIDLIVGTSAGSIVGALYADKMSYADIKKKVMQLNKWDLLDPSLNNTLSLSYTTSGIIEGKRFIRFLENNLSAKNFEETKIPAVFVATDLLRQKAFIFNKGPIIPAVVASSAIPPVFPPVEVYNRILIDGGVVEPVPVRIAKMYHPQLIIAVDISEPPIKEMPKNTLDLTYWALWVSYNELAYLQSKLADVTIKPELAGFGIFNDESLQELYDLGVVAAEKQMYLIKIKLKALNIK